MHLFIFGFAALLLQPTTKEVHVDTGAGKISVGVSGNSIADNITAKGPKDLELGVVIPVDLSDYYSKWVEIQPFYVERVEQSDKTIESRSRGLGLKVTFGRPEENFRWYVRAKVVDDLESNSETQLEGLVVFEFKFGGVSSKERTKLDRLRRNPPLTFKIAELLYERAKQKKMDLSERQSIHIFVMASYIQQVRVLKKIAQDEAISREQITRFMQDEFMVNFDILGEEPTYLAVRPTGRVSKYVPTEGFLDADQMIQDFFDSL